MIDEKIFTMHGGLSPELNSMEQIRRVMRPTDIPDCGLLCDLLWSDPEKLITGWSENDRGVSFTFGPDVVSRFLQKHDMDLICRAHQVVEDGYEFFSKRQLVTLFSAPNYCGEFDNAGAMMSVDENLLCSFQVCLWVKRLLTVDTEASGEKAKVRLWRDGEWATSDPSTEAEEKVEYQGEIVAGEFEPTAFFLLFANMSILSAIKCCSSFDVLPLRVDRRGHRVRDVRVFWKGFLQK